MSRDISKGDTQSIQEVIQQIEADRLILPEFQRDFVWELSKSIDLFDSLSRGIYIGSLIYGSPTKGIAYRSIKENKRVREKATKNKDKKIGTLNVITDRDVEEFKANGTRLILDGQQRLTALYRAVHGIDQIWCVGKDLGDLVNNNNENVKEQLKSKSLEELMDKFSTKEVSDRVCVKILDAYDLISGDDDDKIDRFKQSIFYKEHPEFLDEVNFEPYKRLYLAIFRGLGSLFKSEKLISYHLLNMEVDKFVLFFERSNSKSIPLTFVDILVAKLYAGNFKLRDKIEEYSVENMYDMKPEVAIRAIAYLVSEGKYIEKDYILTSLSAENFKEYWDDVVTYYDRSISYLVKQHYIQEPGDLPYENMLIPLILFQYHLHPCNIDSIDSRTAKILDWWYWSVAFSRHYSGSSNEAIRKDAKFLIELSNTINHDTNAPVSFTYEEIEDYFSELKPVFTNKSDVASSTVTRNPLYFGFMGLIRKRNHGQINLNNNTNISGKIDSHHIFPKEYLKQQGKSNEEIDKIANRVLIEKVTNIKISKKAPSVYLKELQEKNGDLKKVLEKLAIPPALVDGIYDKDYRKFIDERSNLLYHIAEEDVFSKKDDIKNEIIARFKLN